MTLSALTAAGAPLAEVSYRLEALGVPFEFHTENVEASGVRALRITVEHPEQSTHRSFADIRRLVEGGGLPGRAARRGVGGGGVLGGAEGAVRGGAAEDVALGEG